MWRRTPFCVGGVCGMVAECGRDFKSTALALDRPRSEQRTISGHHAHSLLAADTAYPRGRAAERTVLRAR
eukprot:526091-Lingulodinium_polyedra.AAC.1